MRIPYGGGIGGVEHHCDSSESYYAHTPGLKVYTPASVEDAYLMLRAAIRLDDPVIFMEPKKLYWSKAEISLEELRQEFDTRWAQVEAQREHGEPYARAGVARTGEDVTLVSYGPSVVTCLAAAEAAAKEGRSVEVIDLRTINPLDEATITASVTKTGRAIVVAEPARVHVSGFRSSGTHTTTLLPLLSGTSAAGDRIRYPLPTAHAGKISPTQCRPDPGCHRRFAMG